MTLDSHADTSARDAEIVRQLKDLVARSTNPTVVADAKRLLAEREP